jgi:hypothetical protein
LTRFAHAVREELWSRGRLVESRLEHGEAREDERGITATDARDDALVAACERELDRLRAATPPDAIVRLVAEVGTEGTSSAMTVRIGPLSIVTTPAHINEDMDLLRRCAAFRHAGTPASGRPAEPLLWLHGSASILLHEAVGHALEHGHAPLLLPEWLHADIPLRMRRATFRDVPWPRMTHVRVSQTGAPFELPADHIAVHLVDGGAYEPLTETVTIRIAAAKRNGEPIAPFTITMHRDAIRFLGATGDPIRYPGVICSREGQELVVDSYAPVLVTELV